MTGYLLEHLLDINQNKRIFVFNNTEDGFGMRVMALYQDWISPLLPSKKPLPQYPCTKIDFSLELN